MAYVTLPEFKSFARITDSDDDYPTLCIEAAQEFTDRFCGRTFTVPTTTTTRYYRPSRDARQLLAFDDLADLVGLTVYTDEALDGTFSTLIGLTTEYRPTVPHDPTWPYTAIKTADKYWFPQSWGGDLATVEVTGHFGWAAVPYSVKHANLLYANRLYQRHKSPQGVQGAGFPGTGGEIVVPWSDPEVTMLLQKYQNVASRIGFA